MSLRQNCCIFECNRPAFIIFEDTGQHPMCITHYKTNPPLSPEVKVKFIFQVDEYQKNQIINKLENIQGRVQNRAKSLFVDYNRKAVESYKTFTKQQGILIEYQDAIKDLDSKIQRYQTEFRDIIIEQALKLLETDISLELAIESKAPKFIEKTQSNQEYVIIGDESIQQAGCFNGIFEQHSIRFSRESSINENIPQKIVCGIEEFDQLIEYLQESNFQVEDFKRLISELYKSFSKINTRFIPNLKAQKVDNFGKKRLISDLFSKIAELEENLETFSMENSEILDKLNKKIEDNENMLKVYKDSLDSIISEIFLYSSNKETIDPSIAEVDLIKKNTSKALKGIHRFKNELKTKNTEIEARNIEIVNLNEDYKSLKQAFDYLSELKTVTDRDLTEERKINRESQVAINSIKESLCLKRQETQESLRLKMYKIEELEQLLSSKEKIIEESDKNLLNLPSSGVGFGIVHATHFSRSFCEFSVSINFRRAVISSITMFCNPEQLILLL